MFDLRGEDLLSGDDMVRMLAGVGVQEEEAAVSHLHLETVTFSPSHHQQFSISFIQSRAFRNTSHLERRAFFHSACQLPTSLLNSNLYSSSP